MGYDPKKFDPNKCVEMTEAETTELKSLVERIAASITKRCRDLGGNDAEVYSSLYTLQDWLGECGCDVDDPVFTTPTF
jgi:hypothetical protein